MTLLGDMTRDSRTKAIIPAWVVKDCHDQKLSPVEFRDVGMKRKRPYSLSPKCSATYASPRRTCPKDCIFYKAGCYAKFGYIRRLTDSLDKYKGTCNVNDLEAAAILYAFRRGVPQDGAKGGRDLRLHIVGDVIDENGARVLAGAAAAFKQLGGGAVWTYTRRWRTVPVDAWGPISVMASVDSVSDGLRASKAGYFPAMVLSSSELSQRPARAVACRSQMFGNTCVECRYCLSEKNRSPTYLDKVLVFKAHGIQKFKAEAAAYGAMR